ncbi:MAG: hypothetical protein HC796_07915 [Synechococcaceae cyanobacterium RL_1_2]|nr:hypothetical protein [Synechococcaceae cyanobacterium RL_1_2]
MEVVDFIVNSANAALKQEFGKGLTDEGVHILEPFVGTGTFITRLLQTGLITPEDLQRKYTQELHANEILLLAYYIAAINIEETYHELAGGDYVPFNGIVLTDTFQMNEHDDKLGLGIFEDNSDRGKAQKGKDITVIFGNPPYSAGQKSQNDNNKNLAYPSLDERIRSTYAKHSTATNKNSLYGSEIRALKWASERIGNRGIIAYVTNGSFIDSNSRDGLRKCLVDEFSSIYCFNLRGNGRTSGETCRKEGHPLFAAHGGKGGSLTPIAILLLIKNPDRPKAKQIFYHDIGDYLTRDQKLETIAKLTSITGIDWQEITPNDAHDWINQRDPAFDNFIALGDKKGNETKTIFDLYSIGVKTNRDSWVYNFSINLLTKNMNKMIDFYNEEVERYKKRLKIEIGVDNFVDGDATKISWSRDLKQDLKKGNHRSFKKDSICIGQYRPFCKQRMYFNKYFNNDVGLIPKLFPKEDLGNSVICIPGIGGTRDFTVFMSNTIPDCNFFISASQCFPLYHYEKREKTDQTNLFEQGEGYSKKENIPDAILKEFQQVYNDTNLTKEDIFYYVYGILHSPEYKTRFAADLKKNVTPYSLRWGFLGIQ